MNNPFSPRADSFRGKYFVFAICLLTFVAAGRLAANSDIPANLDGGLRALVAEAQSGQGVAAAVNAPISLRGMARVAVRDSQSRVMATIHLNGKTSLSEVRSQLNGAGASIAAENATYRNGVISAFVPVNQLAQLARSSGVLSMSLGRRPIRNAGLTTSGGAFELRTDVLNGQGLVGTGITVGVLSDSYDAATTDLDGNPLTDHAAEDVASDDLPGTGNPNGNTDPVNVLDELLPANGPGFDEGRAMLQIVHDIAPRAKLAFASAFNSDVSFANNIRNLRTLANCDVIVDDVFYTQEPFFSDGMIAQAVDDVAFSSVLAGNKCAYFSAAGNQQGGGWVSIFNPVSDSAARAGLPGQNVDLSAVSSTLTSGGFHNFNPNPAAPPDISQSFVIPAQTSVEIDFQWNDPFDIPGGVTTDYNVLIFDASGNLVTTSSSGLQVTPEGTNDNFSTQEPIEDITVQNTTDDDTTFQIVVSRAGTTPAIPVATKIRYIGIDNFGDGVGAAEYYQPSAPATFGHSCATGALGTAAYVYDDDPSNPPGPPFTPAVEDFTSQGPATIDFDSSGTRLTQTDVRQKPDIAAPDGGNTTFFGDDYEGDGFPNFFGTSAAAPHAAGVAALLLQKAGGPASLTEQQIRTAMENSVLHPHDIDPFFSEGIATATRGGGRKSKGKGKHGKAGASITVTAFGNSSNASSQDPNFFTVTFTPGKSGESLLSLTINLSNAGLEFDSTTETGFPLTFGNLKGISPTSITTNVPAETPEIPSVTLFFARNSFTSATSVSFGIDRDFIGDGGGNGADLLEGATIVGQTSKGKKSWVGVVGSFSNTLGTGYTILDGFGLIDAVKAAGGSITPVPAQQP